ncbi:MAG: hypothetical protein OI74_05100 [Gammaproteobacteria bacterium (ex Lamellibrachia satsuma)]|nr:MAG: hypothetical protein OI74_05100 [Gammaproteobacteria bacterium (ex Lamellibrachia satsuma)]RRS37466.1 MAG: hypothetical protein NV67_01200 [Gammaproteobacteria bacterium (ex Lamellibrachia satsuma)]
MFIAVITTFFSGCASVPMGSIEEDADRKMFALPTQGMSGLYVYRNSNFGAALKKAIYVDGQFIGESAPMTYFYKEVKAGQHTISTQSEFSNNDFDLNTKSNTNYFLRHYIKMGVFVGGANIEIMSEEEGKKGVQECQLAKELNE